MAHEVQPAAITEGGIEETLKNVVEALGRMVFFGVTVAVVAGVGIEKLMGTQDAIDLAANHPFDGQMS